jgi:hypothetical protein
VRQRTEAAAETVQHAPVRKEFAMLEDAVTYKAASRIGAFLRERKYPVSRGANARHSSNPPN